MLSCIFYFLVAQSMPTVCLFIKGVCSPVFSMYIIIGVCSPLFSMCQWLWSMLTVCLFVIGVCSPVFSMCIMDLVYADCLSKGVCSPCITCLQNSSSCVYSWVDYRTFPPVWILGIRCAVKLSPVWFLCIYTLEYALLVFISGSVPLAL